MPAPPIGSSAAATDGSRRPHSFALAAASHLAVWPGAYLVGAVACLAQVAGVDALVSTRAAIISAGFVFCTAAAVYLLDRVKLRDRWLDPADAQAHPDRYAFISTHTKLVRWLIVILLAKAAILGFLLFEWAAVIPLIAVTGVLIYAGRPRAARPRPKDILLLKNAYVALGITGFSLLVVLAAATPQSGFADLWHGALAHLLPLTLSCAHLFVRVLADAILCDLDDEAADRSFGTDTLPNQLGRARAWNIAFAMRLCAAAALLLTPALPFWPRVVWASVTVASSIALRLIAPIRVRDWVDARLAIEAAVVAASLMVIQGS